MLNRKKIRIVTVPPDDQTTVVLLKISLPANILGDYICVSVNILNINVLLYSRVSTNLWKLVFETRRLTKSFAPLTSVIELNIISVIFPSVKCLYWFFSRSITRSLSLAFGCNSTFRIRFGLLTLKSIVILLSSSTLFCSISQSLSLSPLFSHMKNHFFLFTLQKKNQHFFVITK